MTGMVMVVWVSQGRWVLVPWWADSLMVECMVWIGRVGDACLGGTAVWWSWCLAPMLSWRSGYVQQRLWSSAGQSMRSHSVAELLHIRRRAGIVLGGIAKLSNSSVRHTTRTDSSAAGGARTRSPQQHQLWDAFETALAFFWPPRIK